MAKSAVSKEIAVRGTFFKIDPNLVTVIGIDTKHKSRKEHPLFDERAFYGLNKHMVASMYAKGNIEPVECRKNGTDKNGNDILEVKFGRQRTLNLREANRQRVENGLEPWPLKVLVSADSDDESGEKMLIENSQRRDSSAVTNARNAKYQLDLGKDEKYVAEVLMGMEVKTMHRTLELLNLDDEVQKAIDQRKISAHAAYELRTETRETQRAILAELLKQPMKAHSGRTDGSLDDSSEGGDEDGDGEAETEAKAPTAKKVKAAVKKAREEEAYTPLSKVTLNRICAEYAKKDSQIKDTISADAIAVIRAVIGKGSPTRVAGLTEVLSYLEEKHAKKAPKPKKAKEPKPEKVAKEPKAAPEKAKKPAKAKKKAAA